MKRLQNLKYVLLISKALKAYLARSKIGVDIVGFGPIGRELAQRLVTDSELKRAFRVVSISDSSGKVCTSKSTDVLKAVKWKNAGKKLQDSKIDGRKETPSSVVVDVTNSDYTKFAEARNRAVSSLTSGKHFVSANKVALSNYFSEITGLAKKKGLEVGYGATICGGLHAINVAKNLPTGEIESASAVLNASTTMILSMLEEDKSLSFEEACDNAAKTGVLESDRSIDLDGFDATAKTAILANVLFPESKATFDRVVRSGIRSDDAKEMISRARKENTHKVRLVSELTPKKISVGAKTIPSNSTLAVSGRFNVVQLRTKTLGEISVTNLGGGVALTASVLISDLKCIASA